MCALNCWSIEEINFVTVYFDDQFLMSGCISYVNRAIFPGSTAFSLLNMNNTSKSCSTRKRKDHFDGNSGV